MPDLKITPDHLSSKRFRMPLPLAYLKAVMLWPDNAEKCLDSQRMDVAQKLFREVERGRQSAPDVMVAMPSGVAEALYWAPSQPAFKRERWTRYYQGIIIGGAVVSMLLSPEVKFAAMLAAWAEEGTKVLAAPECKKPKIQLGWRNIETNVWPKLRPVAHLWAAFRTSHVWAKTFTFPCSVEELPEFLAAAEYLRLVGARRRFGRGNGALFEADAMWVYPQEVELPAPPEKLLFAFPADR